MYNEVGVFWESKKLEKTYNIVELDTIIETERLELIISCDAKNPGQFAKKSQHLYCNPTAKEQLPTASQIINFATLADAARSLSCKSIRNINYCVEDALYFLPRASNSLSRPTLTMGILYYCPLQHEDRNEDSFYNYVLLLANLM